MKNSTSSSFFFNLLILTPAALLSLLAGGGGLSLFYGALIQNKQQTDEKAPAPAVAAVEAPAAAPVSAPAAAATSSAPAGDLLAKGQTVYSTVCIACHQPTGLGLPGVFPPLAGSDWVKPGDPSRMIAIVLCGLQGKVQINGAAFITPMAMPPQAAMLNDEQIAGALSFVRSSWGNSASAVSVEQVKAMRAKLASRNAMWSQEELEKSVPLKDASAQAGK